MFVGLANIGKTTLLGKLREDGVTTQGWHERRENKKYAGMLDISEERDLCLIFYSCLNESYSVA